MCLIDKEAKIPLKKVFSYLLQHNFYIALIIFFPFHHPSNTFVSTYVIRNMLAKTKLKKNLLYIEDLYSFLN